MLLLPSLLYPFGRDQGVFAYVGRVILEGGWPYRDVWELKPPGIYYTYAAMLSLTGSSMLGVRALDLAAAVTTACVLAAALSRFLGPVPAWLGGLTYAALYLRLGFWGMAQAESFANLWTAIALILWLRAGEVISPLRSSGRVPAGPGTHGVGGSVIRSSFPAGAAAALALLLKVTVLLPLAGALGAVSFLRTRRAAVRVEGVSGLALLSGLAAVLGIVLLAMVLSGAGAAYLEIQHGFVAGYVAMARDDLAATGWQYLWRLYALPLALAIVGLWSVSGRGRLLLGTWLIAAALSVWVQRKYFGYHWTPVLLPLAGLAGAGLAALLSPLQRLTARRAWAGAATGALLIALWSVEREASGYGAALRLMTGRMSREAYWTRFGRPYRGDFSFAADRWAARYVRDHTRPGDPVFIWGFEPLILFLADRRAPTRFVFAVPLVSAWTPDRWRDELMRDLRAHPPVLFGVMRRDALPHASGRSDDSATQLEAFPALRAFLREQYRYETTIEDLTLYRLKRASPPQVPAASSCPLRRWCGDRMAAWCGAGLPGRCWQRPWPDFPLRKGLHARRSGRHRGLGGSCARSVPAFAARQSRPGHRPETGSGRCAALQDDEGISPAVEAGAAGLELPYRLVVLPEPVPLGRAGEHRHVRIERLIRCQEVRTFDDVVRLILADDAGKPAGAAPGERDHPG